MERVRLGRSSLEVTRLGLGTAPLGGAIALVGDDHAAAALTPMASDASSVRGERASMPKAR